MTPDVGTFEPSPYIGRADYSIDPGFFLESGLVNLGDGVDMSDPQAPRRRAGHMPLNLHRPAMAALLETEPYTLTESFGFGDASSAYTEAQVLAAYFKGRYRFVSAEAALRQATEERKSSRSVYAILEASGRIRDITELLPGRTLAWSPDMRPEFEGGEGSDEDFARQFLLDFGSHYVSSIEYGYRLAIRGKLTTTDSTRATEVHANFKAAFMGSSAEGGISDDVKQSLQKSDLELTFAATSGGLFVDGQQRPGILTKLEDILTTLNDLRSGHMVIHASPLRAVARTYWNLLPVEFARSRALLQERGPAPLPEGFYGVPAGTVVSWSPTASQVRTDPDGTRTLVVPIGWALCDGSRGTPDLRDRFVMGSTAFDTLGQAGGAPTHSHSASTGKSKKNHDEKGGAFAATSLATDQHTHDVTVKSASHVPPHIVLAFLMKLPDSVPPTA